MKKLISLVCPVYNEAETVNNHYIQLSAMADTLKNYDFEFIYTDNHSEDVTFSILQEICSKDPRVKAFRFSRNFGYQNSIMTAYQNASGDGAMPICKTLRNSCPRCLKNGKWAIKLYMVFEKNAKMEKSLPFAVKFFILL